MADIAELPGGAVGFLEAEDAIHGRERAVVAGGRIVGGDGSARTAIGEQPVAAQRAAHEGVAVGLRLDGDVPVMRPAPAQGAEAVAGNNRLAIDAPEDERESGRRHGGVHCAGELAHGMERGGGLQHLEVEQRARLGDNLAEGGEVIGVVVEGEDVISPERADVGGEILPDGVPGVGRDGGGAGGGFERVPVDGEELFRAGARVAAPADDGRARTGARIRIGGYG